jgi:hypothetical protein
MKYPFLRAAGLWPVLALLPCALPSGARAETVPVRNTQGTIHGFLEMRSEDGHVVASGDIVQVAHADRVTSRTLFTFKDGSTDDETTVFSQRRTFQLISDHHIQKGPFFPHPMDLMVDVPSHQVTVRTTGKDGKEEVKTDHIDLPPDLGNGMVALLLQNVRANAGDLTVPLLVTTPKPRLVKLVISRRGEDSVSIAGASRKAEHYEIRIEIGGIAGLVAPLIGKAPPNIQIWVIGGEASTFVREQGPLFEDGPVMTIQLASPVWPEPAKAGS